MVTIRRDGPPQVTPNRSYWDGSRFYISTAITRQKYPNLTRDPPVPLMRDESPGFCTVLIDGRAKVREVHERGLPNFARITEKGTDRSPSEATLRDRLAREQQVLIVITPERPPEQWSRWMR